MDTLADALHEWYSTPGNGCGGWLHIVTDDFNVEDGFIDWCIDQRHRDARDAVGLRLAGLLLALPEEQREQALQDAHIEYANRR